MDEVKIEPFFLADGRRGEKHIKDSGEECVTELHVEPERAKQLATRIIEKKRPCVVSREIQTINANGEVVDTKIESVDPATVMGATPQLSLQSVPASEEDCNCFVTKEDLEKLADQMAASTREGIVTAAKIIMEQQSAAAPTTANVSKVSSIQQEIANRIENSGKPKNMLWTVLIVSLLGVLGYVVFAM